jgi:hypothetical protein
VAATLRALVHGGASLHETDARDCAGLAREFKTLR